jgi:hypothetical protein
MFRDFAARKGRAGMHWRNVSSVLFAFEARDRSP